MNNTAFVFPGQGAQYTGMGLDLANNFKVAKEVFEAADEACGRKISEICFEGPDEILKETKNTQPCILAVSLAGLEVLKAEAGVNPKAVAGHSLGEYGALYASGVLSLENALKITAKRAELTDIAACETNGGMAAVLGLNDEAVEEIIAENFDNLWVANYNCPGQIVITGDKEAIEKSVEIFKSKGAKRVLPLAVSGAFHSQFMKSAAEKFEDFINDFTFNDAKIPVYENTDANAVLSGEEIKKRVVKQIYSSVMWTKTVQNMVNDGVERIIEIGPGKVLSGLCKKISGDIAIYNVSDVKSLEDTLNILKGENYVRN